MGLPINELIHGHTVEWERLEFKGGQNPGAIAGQYIIHNIEFRG